MTTPTLAHLPRTAARLAAIARILTAAAATLAVNTLAGATLTAGAAAATPGDRDHDRWALGKEGTLRQTFTLAPAAADRRTPRTVEIDNFHGEVRVTGRAGSEVTMVVHQTWQADSAAKLAEAQQAVRLDATQDGGHLRLYVDGPFRSRDHGIDFHGWRNAGYEARFDFTVEVPADVDLVAKTVTGGAVHVADVAGRFDAANVNGTVTLERMGGAGDARSVNGAVAVGFSRNPTAACHFATVNGKVDVSFPAGLSADLSFKTMNGEVYTDFPYTYRALETTSDTSGTHHHYKSRGQFGARIAAGGPELSFSTINGDILIHRLNA
jgi:hypothetical protein